MGWLLGSGGRGSVHFKPHPALAGLCLQGGIPQEISPCTVNYFAYGLSQDLRTHPSPALGEEVEGP